MEQDREVMVESVASRLGCPVPVTLADIWAGAVVIESGVDITFCGPEEIEERNLTYEIQQYRPDLLLIGDDGGGRGWFVPRNDPDPDVIRIDLGAVGSDDGQRLGRLSELAADGFRKVRGFDASDSQGFPAGLIDILLTERPAVGARGLVEIRRALGLQLSISQLVGANSFPVTLLVDVYFVKYADAIASLNQRYHCLAVRSHQD